MVEELINELINTPNFLENYINFSDSTGKIGYFGIYNSKNELQVVGNSTRLYASKGAARRAFNDAMRNSFYTIRDLNYSNDKNNRLMKVENTYGKTFADFIFRMMNANIYNDIDNNIDKKVLKVLTDVLLDKKFFIIKEI
jgi:hypothetical protein